ncbi:MAG: response regulator [Brevundimonas sp.]|uniref:response regulator n=1 Tax=Brevundimonas sp. TaxID=1871086 RepID=UPI00391A6E45
MTQHPGLSTPDTCVLIAEDEGLIAALIEMTLEDEGLTTSIACSGREAAATIRAHPTGFQILVTDIRVGDPPDGWAIAEAARAANPAIGVIYITGDSMSDWRTRGVPHSILIPKPFMPSQVAAAVQTLLDQAA